MNLRRLLYGTTTQLVVTLSETLNGGTFRLYAAEGFNVPTNPPSADPYRIFRDYTAIVSSNDLLNPKYLTHLRAVKRWIRVWKGTPAYGQAVQIIKGLGIRAVDPYLVLVDQDAYEAHKSTTLTPLPAGRATNPTCREYLVPDIAGPSATTPEMYLHKLH